MKHGFITISKDSFLNAPRRGNLPVDVVVLPGSSVRGIYIVYRGYSIGKEKKRERGGTSGRVETQGNTPASGRRREKRKEKTRFREGEEKRSRNAEWSKENEEREPGDTRDVPLRTEDYHRISCSVMTGQKSGEKEHFLGDAFFHVKERINSPVLAPSVITLRPILADVRSSFATGLHRAVLFPRIYTSRLRESTFGKLANAIKHEGKFAVIAGGKERGTPEERAIRWYSFIISTASLGNVIKFIRVPR